MLNSHDVTWLSLVPSIITISAAFLTRQVLISLILGVISGGVALALQTGDITDLNVVKRFLLPAIGSPTYATVLIIYLWSLGGIIGTWAKTGNANFFAEHLGKKLARGPKSSLFFAWCLGMIFHQGGTISTILTGTTVKPIADHYKVSHEELSYVVDSTASPVATIIPFNAWPLVISGLVIGSVPFIQNPIDAYKIYISSIGFNFYALIAISMTLLFALDLMPWVGSQMQAAKKRARQQGLLDSPTSQPMLTNTSDQIQKASYYKPSLIGFFVPIAILLLFTIGPFLLWKSQIISEKNANWANEAFLLSAISAIVIAKVRGMKADDLLDGFMGGCRDMTIGALILALAFTMGAVAQELHTANYLINFLFSDLSGEQAHTTLVITLPAILMLICMIIAFSTGTAFGTYAVVFPIALPLAYSLKPELQYIQVCFGAVLGGTVFGDQCSPISDTTILSSMFTGCDIMDHVKTQIPMALLAAGLASCFSTAIVWFNSF